MKRSVLAISALLVSTSMAFAGGGGHGGHNWNKNVNNNVNKNINNNWNQNIARANARSSSVANATGGNGYGGNSYGGNTVVNARSAATAYSNATVGGANACGATASAGIQTVGFGFSFGIPIEQEACTRRLNAFAIAECRGNRACLRVLAQDQGTLNALVAEGVFYVVQPGAASPAVSQSAPVQARY